MPPPFPFDLVEPDVEPRAEQEGDDKIKIACECGYLDDDGNTIACASCDQWQHLLCYYPAVEALPDDVTHYCVRCRPRTFNTGLAQARQRQARRHLSLPVSRQATDDTLEFVSDGPSGDLSGKGTVDLNRLGKLYKPRKRTKTGCLTCRKRRVACSQERPICQNCVKSKRSCEGYNQRFIFKQPLGIVPHRSVDFTSSEASHSLDKPVAVQTLDGTRHRRNVDVADSLTAEQASDAIVPEDEKNISLGVQNRVTPAEQQLCNAGHELDFAAHVASLDQVRLGIQPISGSSANATVPAEGLASDPSLPNNPSSLLREMVWQTLYLLRMIIVGAGQSELCVGTGQLERQNECLPPASKTALSREYHTLRLWLHGLQDYEIPDCPLTPASAHLLRTAVSIVSDIATLMLCAPSQLKHGISPEDFAGLTKLHLQAVRYLQRQPGNESNPGMIEDPKASSDEGSDLEDDELPTTTDDFLEDLTYKVKCLVDIGPALDQIHFRSPFESQQAAELYAQSSGLTQSEQQKLTQLNAVSTRADEITDNKSSSSRPAISDDSGCYTEKGLLSETALNTNLTFDAIPEATSPDVNDFALYPNDTANQWPPQEGTPFSYSSFYTPQAIGDEPMTGLPETMERMISVKSNDSGYYSSARTSAASSVGLFRDPTLSERGFCPVPTCGKFFRDLHAHMLTHQNERPEKCPVPTCEYHTKGFARKYDWNRHTLTHYKGTMVCGFCPGTGSAVEKTFFRADVFKRHLTSVHGVEQNPPNARKRSTGRGELGKGRSLDRSPGVCSICSVTFADPQDFYEHLDDCVLRVVHQAVSNEAQSKEPLSTLPEDQVQPCQQSLGMTNKHPIPTSVEHNVSTPPDVDDHNDYDLGNGADLSKDTTGKSDGNIFSPRGDATSKLEYGSTHDQVGVYSSGTTSQVRSKQRRKIYPLSWGASPDKMLMKKRVLCVYDGERRLSKDDMVEHGDLDIHLSSPKLEETSDGISNTHRGAVVPTEAANAALAALHGEPFIIE